MATTVHGIDTFHELVGKQLGYSEWHRIDQDQVNLFADATGDHQWIHVDPERAKAGPFGGAIAHGYLTLSLAPVLLNEILLGRRHDLRSQVRLQQGQVSLPVPVGSNLRMGVGVESVEDVKGGVQVVFGMTFETEGSTKPSCVAEVVYRYFH